MPRCVTWTNHATSWQRHRRAWHFKIMIIPNHLMLYLLRPAPPVSPILTETWKRRQTRQMRLSQATRKNTPTGNRTASPPPPPPPIISPLSDKCRSCYSASPPVATPAAPPTSWFLKRPCLSQEWEKVIEHMQGCRSFTLIHSFVLCCVIIGQRIQLQMFASVCLVSGLTHGMNVLTQTTIGAPWTVPLSYLHMHLWILIYPQTNHRWIIGHCNYPNNILKYSSRIGNTYKASTFVVCCSVTDKLSI